MRESDVYQHLIQEGLVFSSKVDMFETAIPGILQGLKKALAISKKYKTWAMKKYKDPDEMDWEEPMIGIQIQQQSVAGSVISILRKKQDKNTEKYKFLIMDYMNFGAKQYKNSQQDFVADSFEVTLKI